MSSKIDLIITSREKDLGGFPVRRVLPYATHRMVGPFIFFDHMGPANFPPRKGMDVRPHPHIGLATVTYLFEGEIFHRDSLGSQQPIQPGAINWMTAGRGIVHSERTPDSLRRTGFNVNGIQCWVALPDSEEEREPDFAHHPKSTLPEFEVEGTKCKLLLGSAFNKQSPVKVYSDMFYLEVQIPKGRQFSFPVRGLECAFYVVSGAVQVETQTANPYTMLVAKSGEDLNLSALEDSRLMILGGAPVGPRFIWWNLVSSSQERLAQAREDWIKGPRDESPRFRPIPGDQQEFIPAPEWNLTNESRKGTIL